MKNLITIFLCMALCSFLPGCTASELQRLEQIGRAMEDIGNIFNPLVKCHDGVCGSTAIGTPSSEPDHYHAPEPDPWPQTCDRVLTQDGRWVDYCR